MRARAVLLASALLTLASGCTLPRATLGASTIDGAGPNDDGGTIDAFRPPIDSAIDAPGSDAPASDAGADAGVDAPAPVDAGSDAGPPVCVPTTEACNLYDDDCDGTTDEDTCGCEHREQGGHVYQLCPAATGFDAWGRCTTLGPGYDLVVIDDAAENDWIKSWTTYEWVFLGLDDFAREDAFVWTNGTPDTLHLFGTGEPNGHQNENCVVTTNGSWLDFTCAGTERYLCEGAARTTPLPMPMTETCDGRDEDYDGAIDESACACPTFVFDHHVYQRCTTGAAWTDARTACMAGGYAMAVIDTLTESQMIGHALPGGSWSGLNDEASEDHFVYESAPGEPISMGNHALSGHFVSWAGGEPNDAGGTHAENCVWVDGGGNWYDFACSRSYGYLCERDIR